ncbi:MAG: hypothetical protein ACYC61_29175 [Isosphaeraceae bacterium]
MTNLYSKGCTLSELGNPVYVLVAKSTSGKRKERVVWLAPDLGWIPMWCPLAASASITVLVLSLHRYRQGSQDCASRPQVAPANELSPWPAARSRICLGLIALSLIGLNLAAALFRPPVDTRGKSPEYLQALGLGDWVGAHFEGFGWVVSPRNRADWKWDDVPEPLLETVICRSDGAVVAYDGDPDFWERLLTRPRYIRHPLYSVVEMWWPVVGAIAVTVAVLLILFRESRLQQEIPTFYFGED